MSMSFKQFVSFQNFGKSDAVFQAASDSEAAYVVVISLLEYIQPPETSVVPVAVSVDGANHAFFVCRGRLVWRLDPRGHGRIDCTP